MRRRSHGPRRCTKHKDVSFIAGAQTSRGDGPLPADIVPHALHSRLPSCCVSRIQPGLQEFFQRELGYMLKVEWRTSSTFVRNSIKK